MASKGEIQMRRGNGDGSIFKLSGKRRKPYAVRVTVGFTDEGKQKYRYIGYYANKTEAKQALAEYLAHPEKALKEKKTLEMIFNSMIEKSDFSEGTKKQYVSGFNKVKHLHKREIGTITLEEVEELMEDESSSVQARIKKTLTNCFKFALKYEYVSRNIMDHIVVKVEEPAEKTVFTSKEIKKVWTDGHVVPIILLYTGMRISELLELRLENIDFNNKTIFIEKSKTPAGIRHIPIHDKILPIVEEYAGAANTHLIENEGKPFAYSTYLKQYWPIENHTPHETRHTFITNLRKSTNDEVAVKKIIGHKLKDITDHYTHKTIEELAAVVNTLEY